MHSTMVFKIRNTINQSRNQLIRLLSIAAKFLIIYSDWLLLLIILRCISAGNRVNSS